MLLLAGMGKIRASRRVVRWLKFRLSLRFDRLVLQKQGLPHLSPRAPQGLIANYQDQAKQCALRIVIDQLLEKKCIRKMSETENGFFSRVFLVLKRAGS